MSIHPSRYSSHGQRRGSDRRRCGHRPRYRGGPCRIRRLGRDLGTQPRNLRIRRAERSERSASRPMCGTADRSTPHFKTDHPRTGARHHPGEQRGVRCFTRRSSTPVKTASMPCIAPTLRHVLLCTQRVARGMVDARAVPGSIINVTSIEGVRAAPGYAAYAAAKAGVVDFTKRLRWSWHRSGIRVNALAPGHHADRGHRCRSHHPAPTERFGYDGADGPCRACRRDGRCRSISRLRHVWLHHRPDHSRRRRDLRGRGLVSPPDDGRVLTRADYSHRLASDEIRTAVDVDGRPGDIAIAPRRQSRR